MEYKKLKLKDCLERVIDNRGKSPRSFKENIDGYIPLVEVNSIATDSPLVDFSLIKKFVDLNTYNTWFRNGHPEKNDILISTVGSIGEVCLVEDEKVCIAQNVVALRANSAVILPKYLFYYLNNSLTKQLLKSLNISSVQPSLKVPHLLDIEIFVPNMDTQAKIVDFLWALDNKVNVNKQLINILEQLTHTLFKRWFVDFEFPNETGEPNKSSGGKMVESELGMHPKHFKVEYLSESVNFLSGGTPKTKIEEYWGGDIPFFTPKDITGSVYVTTTEKSITELGLSKCNSKLYPKNTLFITARGTVGKLNLANKNMAMNQSCFALQHKQNHQFFLYFLVETLLKEIIQGSTGAVFNAINLKDLNTLKVVSPPSELKRRFNEFIQPFFNMMSEKEEENIYLKELHHTLLPKLLSGEIELPDETEVTDLVPVS